MCEYVCVNMCILFWCETFKKDAFKLEASARASRVLPVPGGGHTKALPIEGDENEGKRKRKRNYKKKR